MSESQKHVFWQALLITLLIFSLGIIFGIVLENWRNTKVEDLYKHSEVDLLDVKLQSEIFSEGSFNCDVAIEENIKFADKVYEEAKKLEEYQKASILTEDLLISHEKYDLLRATLLLNSNKIRKKCSPDYYEVVYLYKYYKPSPELLAKETVFSKLLGELKEKKGSDMLLIPLAGDSNLTSVNLLLSRYNLSREDLPIIIINDKIKIRELKTISEMEIYFKEPLKETNNKLS